MLSRGIFVALALTAGVSAHCGVSPALGVTGTFTKADVQRVVAGSNCGRTNVANTIDSSTAVPADATGAFTVTANSFDPGSDGSSLMTATLDTTGTGKTFPTDVTITQNGNAVQSAPSSTQQIAAVLPPGTVCKGGKAGNLCLVAFKTSAGFQNCVVVSQAAATGGSSAVSTTTGTTGTTGTAGTTDTTGTTDTNTNATTSKAKKVKKVKLTAAQKAAKKAAKAAKKAAAAGGAAAGGAAAGTVAADPAATVSPAASKRAVGSRAARAARAGVLA